MQSGDWWIITIHNVILVFTSGIDKNQNGAKETSTVIVRAFVCRLLATHNFFGVSPRNMALAPNFHVNHYLITLVLDFTSGVR